MNNIKSKLISLRNDPLARGSAILFIGSTGVNALSYLYNLIIGRMLTVVQYGEYLALVTLVYLLSIPFGSIQTVVIKYVSQLHAQSNPQQIKKLLIMLTKFTTIVSLIITTILILITPYLGSILKINNPVAIILTGLLFTVFTVPTVLTASFNGVQKFGLGTVLGGIGLVVRIIISIVTINLGYSVSGVLAAIIVGIFVTYLLSWHELNRILDTTSHQLSLIQKMRSFVQKLFRKTPSELEALKQDIIKFTIPATIATIGIAALTQLDIILVKIFFTPFEAGIYSSLAIIGKIIPFFTLPLLTALFPELVARVTRKQNFLKPFYTILAIISAVSVMMSVLYGIFPELVIRALFGVRYLNAVPYIGLFGLFQTIFTIMNAYVMFFLATGYNKLAAQSIAAAVFQVIGILFFHDSLQQVILVSIAICTVFSLYYSVCTVRLAYSTNKPDYDRKKR